MGLSGQTARGYFPATGSTGILQEVAQWMDSQEQRSSACTASMERVQRRRADPGHDRASRQSTPKHPSRGWRHFRGYAHSAMWLILVLKDTAQVPECWWLWPQGTGRVERKEHGCPLIYTYLGEIWWESHVKTSGLQLSCLEVWCLSIIYSK